jgi:uncharacterized membrane protein
MTVVRYLHVLGMVFFVGGQLMLAIVVTPAVHRHGTAATMRDAARRFGMASAVALVVLIATGVALASHLRLWSSPTLHAKLALLVLVLVLLGLHVVTPRSRWLSLGMLAASLVIVWLGLELAHG